jgi:hypothetical protein
LRDRLERDREECTPETRRQVSESGLLGFADRAVSAAMAESAKAAEQVEAAAKN